MAKRTVTEKRWGLAMNGRVYFIAERHYTRKRMIEVFSLGPAKLIRVTLTYEADNG